MEKVKFSPIQRRMLELFSDGLPHTKNEVWECIGDHLAPLTNVAKHIFLLRKKMEGTGEWVVCEYSHRRIFYRHVILLSSKELVLARDLNSQIP